METVRPQSLKQLLNKWKTAVEGTSHPHPPVYDGPDIEITSIVEHTNHVNQGACFVARVRTGTDGHPYIGKAIAKGANLIVGQRNLSELDIDFGNVPYLKVEDTAIAEAWLSAAWYGFPSEQLTMIGVTGTDGKTTTVNLIYQILQKAGIRAGLLSTLKAVVGDTEESLALHVTTPEAPVIQEFFRRMVDAGLTHCVLEVTSHGLAQNRVGAIDFDLAIVTNITHEHLDYHGDFEDYLKAKSKLFESLNSEVLNSDFESLNKHKIQKTAVLNLDDSSYSHLVKIPTPRQIEYGLNKTADVYASNIDFGTTTTHFILHLPSNGRAKSPNQPKRYAVTSSLLGEFNVYNMLAAAAAAHAIDVPGEAIVEGLETVSALSGRMQRIDRDQDFLVLVDFAHTPNALGQALSAARRMTNGKVIAVFGSAGKRDVMKRRIMAEISTIKADLTVLTAEDPRTESLDNILETMAGGCRDQGGTEGKTFWRLPDRGQAIYFALSLACSGDLVLICGKGHEQSMCFETTEYPWDDVKVTEIALDAFLAGQPMPDTGLPTYDQQSGFSGNKQKANLE